MDCQSHAVPEGLPGAIVGIAPTWWRTSPDCGAAPVFYRGDVKGKCTVERLQRFSPIGSDQHPSCGNGLTTLI